MMTPNWFLTTSAVSGMVTMYVSYWVYCKNKYGHLTKEDCDWGKEGGKHFGNHSHDKLGNPVLKE